MTLIKQQSVRRAIPKLNQTVMVYAYLLSNQSALTGNAWTQIAMTKVAYDVGLNYDTATHRLTAPVTGLYGIKGAVHFTSVITAKRYMAAIYKNGVAIKYAYQQSNGTADLSVLVDFEVFLQQGDYIELYAQPEVGGGVNTVAAVGGKEYTSFIVRLLTKEGIRQ